MTVDMCLNLFSKGGCLDILSSCVATSVGRGKRESTGICRALIKMRLSYFIKDLFFIKLMKQATEAGTR